jgi:hypothetical protein
VKAEFTMRLTCFGKQRVTESMYLKGKAFIGAAILLRRQAPSSEETDYVFLHLLCQGIEITLKGLLLHKDYDKYFGRLKKKPLHHNLFEIAKEASSAYGFKPMRAGLADELRTLSNPYSEHLLRYGGEYDIVVDPRTIPRDKVLRRFKAAIRLAERRSRD